MIVGMIVITVVGVVAMMIVGVFVIVSLLASVFKAALKNHIPASEKQ
jgi:uncharacterized membrane protein